MRAMKDSGIEWIGEIPQEWSIRRIKHLANGEENSFSDGDWIDSPYIADEGIRYLTTGNIGDGVYKDQGKGFITKETFEKLKCIYAFPGDLVFSRLNTPYGRSCILPDFFPEYVIAVDNVILRTDEEKRYLCYLTQCHGYQHIVEEKANGTTMKRVSRAELGNIYLPIPDRHEQEKIANFLDTKCAEIDVLIAAKEKTNALLKERRQSIIYEAVTKGLDPTVPMKDSGVEWIGDIPEGWKVCRIKHLTDKSHPYPVGDGDHGLIKADDYQNDGIPYIRVLNLTWGMGLNLENLVFISEEMNDRIKNSELKPNDILVAKTGATIGKTAIVPDTLPLSNTTSHVGKITISHDYDAKYFFYVTTSFIVQKQIVDLSSMQSTRPELGIDGLKNLIVTFPPLKTQQRISQYLDCKCAEIDSLISSNERITKRLREYRQSLIYEAVTGKIEV